MDSLITFEKLTAQHLPYLYEIRFSVEENLLHPHQIQYLQRRQALEDINQGGGWICKHGDDYAGVGFGLFIPEPLIGGLFVKPEYQSKGIGSALLAVRVKVVVASVNLCGQRFPLWIQPDFVLPTPVSCCS
ncbi:GNAT family N-acetyltransferase [Serratia sp. (in: enterobacteria)]|uniref:GNAT family N-acetyltransferase n=1 Tax=Serratia sp. (in: enterobacteria) TaxID=616 RepID=UPI003F2FD602